MQTASLLPASPWLSSSLHYSIPFSYQKLLPLEGPSRVLRWRCCHTSTFEADAPVWDAVKFAAFRWFILLWESKKSLRTYLNLSLKRGQKDQRVTHFSFVILVAFFLLWIGENWVSHNPLFITHHCHWPTEKDPKSLKQDELQQHRVLVPWLYFKVRVQSQNHL